MLTIHQIAETKDQQGDTFGASAEAGDEVKGTGYRGAHPTNLASLQ